MIEILLKQNGILIPEKEGYFSAFDAELNLFTLQMPNGRLRYFPGFLTPYEADKLLRFFMEKHSSCCDDVVGGSHSADRSDWKNIPWRQDFIKMFGKMVLQPRLTSWFADEGKGYRYSGLDMIQNTWNSELLELKSNIEKAAQTSFNSVLMNAYRDGRDHMGWHADDERELGLNPVIASVNFGASRRFLMRRNENQEEKVEILLQHGSLLLMEGEMQHYWKHAIPKQLKVGQLRVNLTFRNII